MLQRVARILLFLLLSLVTGELSGVPLADAETATEKWSTSYARSHAVVIGVDAYTAMPPLKYAVKDAKSVAAVLERRGFEVTLLLDAEATKSNIERTLFKSLPGRLGPNDRVLVFFAGHGISKHEMGYLMPVDAKAEDAAFAGVEMGALQEAFANPSMYPSKHVLYVADACYSGLALSSRGASVRPKTGSYVGHILRHKVRVALTAGGDDEEVMEKNGHGLFTHQFLEALNGAADLDQDGIITTAELWPYLSKEVSQASRRRQTPQYGRSGTGEFVFRNLELAQPAVSLRVGAGETATVEARGLANAARKERAVEVAKRLLERGKDPTTAALFLREALTDGSRPAGWRAVARKLVGARTADRIIQTEAGSNRRLAVSPDGQQLAMANDDEVRVWRLTDLDAPAMTLAHNWNEAIQFSPDGRWLLARGRKASRLWRSDGKGAPRDFAPGPNDAAEPVFSPDGERVAFVEKGGTVKVWMVDDEYADPVVLKTEKRVVDMTFGPKGKTLVTASLDTPDVLVWRVDGRGSPRRLSHEGTPVRGGLPYVVRHVDVSSDGRYILTGTWDGLVTLWRASGKSVRVLQKRFTDTRWYTLAGCQFHPSKPLVLCVDRGASKKERPAGGRGAWVFGTGGKGDPWYVPDASHAFWTTDGAALVTMQGESVDVFETKSRARIDRIPLETTYTPLIAVPPDNRILMGAYRALRLYGPRNAHRAHWILKHPAPVNWARFSTKGLAVETRQNGGKGLRWHASRWAAADERGVVASRWAKASTVKKGKAAKTVTAADGQLEARIDGFDVVVTDPRSPDRPLTLSHRHEVKHVVLDAEGRRLAIVEGRVVHVHDLAYLRQPEAYWWRRVKGCSNAFHMGPKWPPGLRKDAPSASEVSALLEGCAARVKREAEAAAAQ